MRGIKKTAVFLAAAVTVGIVQVAAQATSAPVPVRSAERAARLSGTLSLPIESLREEISPVRIRFGELVENTGPIQLALDPAAARDARITFDFDKMTVSLSYQALVQAELLRAKGAPPMRLTVTENGRLQILASRPASRGPAARKRIITVAFSTESSGTIEDKPLAGALYRQHKGGPADCPRYPPQRHCRGKVVALDVDADGRVLGGAVVDQGEGGLASDAAGQIEFAGQVIPFTGRRFGVIGSK